MIPIDISDKTALVTGATGELGRVIARTLARAGADIAVHYHVNSEQADLLVSDIEEIGSKAAAVRGDITDRTSVSRMKTAVQKELGPPDILVTNAVIQYDWKTILDQAPEDYESQFRSSVLHNVLTAQAFLPAMIEKGWGRVIGINTECSMQYWKNQSAYIAGKRGMDGVLRVLAREVGEHSVTVNQVAPGWTVSENRPETDSTQWYRERVPLKRRGTDQDIAHTVAFLASDLAGFITGAFIPVCGGNIMPAI